MKKLAFLVFVVICLTGCKQRNKNYNTVVSGLILDKVTGNPIANATVYLGIIESGFAGVSATTVDKTTSDAYGRYSFGFVATKGKDYAIMGKADKYFTTESVSEYQIEEGKKNESFNIDLKPIAVIKIHLKKTDISYDSLSFACNLKESGTTQVAFGKFVDTNLLYTNQVAGKNIYLYTYIKKIVGQASIPYTIDSVYQYLIPLDTTYINFNY